MAIQKDTKLNEINDNIIEPVEEVSEKDKTDELKEYEGDILSAILDAASFKESDEETYLIRIIRNKKALLKFRIRPLSEEEYEKCRRKNTKYVRNKRLGIQVPETTNQVRFRSQLIYTATVEADRKKLWDNKDAWDKLNVASGIDLVDVVLKGGEKDEIVDQIDKISGFSLSDLEEAVKN